MTSDYSRQFLCTEISRKNLLEQTSAQKTVGMGMGIQAQKPGFIALRTRHRGAVGAERFTCSVRKTREMAVFQWL